MRKNHENKRNRILDISLVTTGVIFMTAATAEAKETIFNSNEEVISTVQVDNNEKIETENKETAAVETLEIENKKNDNLKNANEEVNNLEKSAYRKEDISSKTSIESYDPTNVSELQKNTNKGLGGIVAVIDTGFTFNHDIFKIDDNFIKNKDIITRDNIEKLKIENKINYGKWINDKIIFTYDYAKNKDIEPNATDILNTSHGTHVSGIIAGNAEKIADNGLRIVGMSPNSQLFLMRIGESTYIENFPEQYAKAITDAVKLGAKVINLSIGKTADAKVTLDKSVIEAVNFAKSKGVLVVAAAGNAGAYGSGYSNPSADNPDFGTINSPSIAEDIISVASYITEKMESESIVLNSNEKNTLIPVRITKEFDYDKTYDFVFANLGKENDYKDINVKDKIVLIDYAGVENSTKTAELAEKFEAAGVIIFNEEFNKPLLPLRYNGNLPIGFISRESYYSLIKDKEGKLKFNKDKTLFDTPGGAQMMKQSSWGVDSEGGIKPDIAAPGYEIYSSSYSDKGPIYEKISGTSMATPHISGIINLLQKEFAKKYPEKSIEEIANLVKKVLMSSASTLFSKEDEAYYSPRQQGAGIVDAKKAMEAQYFLTDENGNHKINLKSIDKNLLEFKVVINKIKNDTANEKLYYQVNLLTDKVKDGKFALKPKALLSTKWESVDVDKNSKELIIKLDISEFDANLQKEMKNGYFLDGFVRFKKQEGSNDELMSIPFIAFKGDFKKLAAIEKPVYNNVNEDTFYHKAEGNNKLNYLEESPFADTNKNNLTALLTSENPFFSAKERLAEEPNEEKYLSEVEKDIFLGTFAEDNSNTSYILEKDEQNKPVFIISPNNDGNRDSVMFQGTFLRAVQDIKIEVLDKNNTVIWSEEKSNTLFRKNFDNRREHGKGYYKLEFSKWDGKDKEGNIVENGEYIYRINYRPAMENAEIQKMEFKIIVKVEKPEIPSKITKTEENDKIIINLDSLGEYRTYVAYEYGGEEGFETKYFYADKNGKIIIDKVIVDNLSLEEKDHIVDLSKLILVVEDKAGNYNSIALNEADKSEKPKVNNSIKNEKKLEENVTKPGDSTKDIKKILAPKKENGDNLEEKNSNKKENTTKEEQVIKASQSEEKKTNPVLAKTGKENNIFHIVFALMNLFLAYILGYRKIRSKK